LIALASWSLEIRRKGGKKRLNVEGLSEDIYKFDNVGYQSYGSISNLSFA
jgi:hypothetical protein